MYATFSGVTLEAAAATGVPPISLKVTSPPPVTAPVPPVAAAYHNKLEPLEAVAVKAVVVVPIHKFTGEVATGAAGVFIETDFESVTEHPFIVYV